MPALKELEEIILTEDLSTRVMCRALLSEADMLILPKIMEILSNDEFKEEIESGKITLAMLKPDLFSDAIMDDKHKKLNEDERCKFLIKQIKAPLESKFEIALPLDVDFLDKWYSDGAKDRQLDAPPIDSERYGSSYKNRWEEFVALMTERTAATFALLYDPDGNACNILRSQIGKTWDVDILKKENQKVLRSDYSKDNHNNLFHGSDDIEAVKREINIVVSLIQRYIDNSVKKS